MAHAIHNSDKNASKRKAYIDKLKKENSAEAKEVLKQEFNADMDGKSKIQTPGKG